MLQDICGSAMAKKKDTKKTSPNHHLNDEDRKVWKQVSDTAEPLKCRPETPSRPKNTNKTIPGATKKPPPSPGKNKLPQLPTAPSFTPASSFRSSKNTPTHGVDKRLQRRLGRGQMEIEARLDLHGKTRAAAHQILKSFLMDAQFRGLRTVLVITGKGEQGIARHTLHSFDVIHTPERSGILMRSVPQWLNEPDFRNLVISFQPAHPKHGGGGALYVRVRRIR